MELKIEDLRQQAFRQINRLEAMLDQEREESKQAQQ